MWGGLLGAGAAFLGGFFTGGMSWSLIPITIAGMMAGAGAEGGLNRWGNNLLNSGQKLGFSEQQLFDLSQKDKKNQQKWLDENYSDIKDLKGQIQKLEEQNNQILQKVETETDPQEKAKILAIHEANKKEIQSLKKELADKQNNIKSVIDNLPQPGLTYQQFQSEAKKPTLGSLKNWGIIALAVLAGIILVSFIKKLFNKLLGEIFH